MSDTSEPIEPAADDPAASDPVADWEAQLADAAEDPTPVRRNGFDHARKKTFLKALTRGATLKEAAKAACVSPQTVYNHQKSDDRFAAECRAAAQVVAPVIELAAFERAVTGVEEDVISYGKHVGTRVKRSDPLLQTLLKGSNPEKYGPNPGFKRGKRAKRKWREQERERLRAEILAEEEVNQEPIEDVRERIHQRITRMCDQFEAEKMAKGYYMHAETDLLVPPGWAVVRIETLHGPCKERQERQESQESPTSNLTDGGVPFTGSTR